MPTQPKEMNEEVKLQELEMPEGLDLVAEPLQKVKTIVRHMADAPTVMPNPEIGLFSAHEIDEYLSAHYDMGYKMHSVFYFGRAAGGGHVFCYIMVLGD